MPPNIPPPGGPEDDARLTLGPKARAGLERAALQLLHQRYPGKRFVIVDEVEPDTPQEGE